MSIISRQAVVALPKLRLLRQARWSMPGMASENERTLLISLVPCLLRHGNPRGSKRSICCFQVGVFVCGGTLFCVVSKGSYKWRATLFACKKTPKCASETLNLAYGGLVKSVVWVTHTHSRRWVEMSTSRAAAPMSEFLREHQLQPISIVVPDHVSLGLILRTRLRRGSCKVVC